jgi:site-specific DNA recombinase
MKRGIRYLRFSSIGQSNGSIEWQDLNTRPWFDRNNVELIDTFIDAGFSAKTFDRPDMDKLTEFIKKYHQKVDYLVVNEMDRFSREAGEALTLVKMLQRKYGVQIVSVMEGITFDYKDNGSFFRTGLQLLLAEEDNIRRANKIVGGIYTAMKKDGRYVGKVPVGYKYEKDGRKPMLVIDEPKAEIVRFIYQSFLNEVPMYMIMREARLMGFVNSGHSSINRILTNPLYTGLLHIRAYKDHVEEMVEGVHTPLISRTDWHSVQAMLKPSKAVQIISEDFPLRSLLLCHCGKPLTGAPSRGKSGRYFNYYKCQVSGHNTINAKKAHDQLLEVFKYMSLPDRIYQAINESSAEILKTKMKNDTLLLKQRRNELNETEKQLRSVEEKFILEQMAYETYKRWQQDLGNKLRSIKADIERLSGGEEAFYVLLQEQLYKLKHMPELYNSASIMEKRQLVKLVFDSRLYYREKVYRTPYVMEVFEHNAVILREKNLLLIEEKTGPSKRVPFGRAYGNRTRDSSVKGRRLNPLTNAPFL